MLNQSVNRKFKVNECKSIAVSVHQYGNNWEILRARK